MIIDHTPDTAAARNTLLAALGLHPIGGAPAIPCYRDGCTNLANYIDHIEQLCTGHAMLEIAGTLELDAWDYHGVRA